MPSTGPEQFGGDVVRTGRRWHRWRLAGAIVGVVLLAAAIWLVVSHANEAQRAWEALERPDPSMIAALLGLTLLLIPVSAAAQSLMLRRTSGVAVELGEMSALVSLATLLNMLPMWPGAIGRIGYHKVVHGVSPMQAGMAVVAVRLIGLVMGIVLLGAVLIWPAEAVIVWLAMLVGLVAATIWSPLRDAGWVVIVKWIDLLLIAARYAVAFSLLGVDLDSANSGAMAGTSEIASSVPFVGGGPGLREWAIGWMTERLSSLPDALVLGVMADLLVRIATLLVMLPCGIVAFRWLNRRLQSSAGSIPRSRTVKSESNA
ncbi:MAG: hypothetical protein QGG74_06740 [Phycisphaerales bacterium]|jgi:hypothetical protein|nr:hypothetical protein [Phycisphaerales bacterium]